MATTSALLHEVFDRIDVKGRLAVLAVCVEAFVLGFAHVFGPSAVHGHASPLGNGPVFILPGTDVLGVEQSEGVLGRPFLDVDHDQGKNQVLHRNFVHRAAFGKVRRGVHVRAHVFPVGDLVQIHRSGSHSKTGLTSTMAGGTKVLLPRVVTSSPSLNQAGKSGCKVWLKSTTREKETSSTGLEDQRFFLGAG